MTTPQRYFRLEKIISMKYVFSGLQTHPFHIVTESPWPYFGASAALCITVGAVMKLHSFEYDFYGISLLQWGFVLVIAVAWLWWRDVIREATYMGYHTSKVVRGLKIGMILFIVSEIMFFFSFFWAFFHASLAPSIALGSVWPPVGINVLNPLHLPLLNTIILIVSGLTVTYSHACICSVGMWKARFEKRYYGGRWPFHWQWINPRELDWPENVSLKEDAHLTDEAMLFLAVTLLLGEEFTCFQLLEYYNALFYINDGVYGSTFYVATGFHGLHVLIGTIFLAVCFHRMEKEHFLPKHHVGFEMAIWYWHFVDVVWLVLYVFIYCWSGGWSAL